MRHIIIFINKPSISSKLLNANEERLNEEHEAFQVIRHTDFDLFCYVVLTLFYSTQSTCSYNRVNLTFNFLEADFSCILLIVFRYVISSDIYIHIAYKKKYCILCGKLSKEFTITLQNNIF